MRRPDELDQVRRVASAMLEDARRASAIAKRMQKDNAALRERVRRRLAKPRPS
jgi:hypothetical protein